LTYEVIGDMFGRLRANVYKDSKIIEIRLKKNRRILVDGYTAAENDIVSFLSK
jgi:hypothetical protein